MPQPQTPVHKEFDKRVQLRDKHGNLTEENHYALHIIDGSSYFERPIGSGNLYEPNGQPSGRLTDRRTQTIDHAAAHLEVTAAPTGAELIAQELDAARSESEELRKELAALRKERELAAKITELEAKVAAPAPTAPAAKPAASGKFAAHIKEE